MNTSLAVTALYDVLKAKTTPATKIALIEDFDRVLGLDLVKAAKKLIEEEAQAAEVVSDDPFIQEIEALIKERADAKKAKDFAKADAIRDELTAMGVTIVDVKGGVNWSK
jgi:cysteinyl-tRNA synthetase